MATLSSTQLNPFNSEPYSATYFALRKIAESLPVFRELEDLLSLIQQNRIVIVVGETGSGKTTQLPKAILQADAEMMKKSGKKLALTQNRRLAAQLVSHIPSVWRGHGARIAC